MAVFRRDFTGELIDLVRLNSEGVTIDLGIEEVVVCPPANPDDHIIQHRGIGDTPLVKQSPIYLDVPREVFDETALVDFGQPLDLDATTQLEGRRDIQLAFEKNRNTASVDVGPERPNREPAEPLLTQLLHKTVKRKPVRNAHDNASGASGSSTQAVPCVKGRPSRDFAAR